MKGRMLTIIRGVAVSPTDTAIRALSALEMAATRWTPHGGPWLQVPGEALVLVLRDAKASVQAGADLQRKAAERDALVSLLQDVVKAVPR